MPRNTRNHAPLQPKKAYGCKGNVCYAEHTKNYSALKASFTNQAMTQMPNPSDTQTVWAPCMC